METHPYLRLRLPHNLTPKEPSLPLLLRRARSSRLQPFHEFPKPGHNHKEAKQSDPDSRHGGGEEVGFGPPLRVGEVGWWGVMEEGVGAADNLGVNGFPICEVRFSWLEKSEQEMLYG